MNPFLLAFVIVSGRFRRSCDPVPDHQFSHGHYLEKCTVRIVKKIPMMK